MLALLTTLRFGRRSSGRRLGRIRAHRRGHAERLRIFVLLIGWTGATGAHWDILQVAAWARMWAGYAQVQPLATALATTFSPEAMCGACKTIQAAKHDQAADPAIDLSAMEKALLLLPSAHPAAVDPPSAIRVARRELVTRPLSWRAAPPVPPPRTGGFAAA